MRTYAPGHMRGCLEVTRMALTLIGSGTAMSATYIAASPDGFFSRTFTDENDRLVAAIAVGVLVGVIGWRYSSGLAI